MKEIASALVKAQKEFGPALKTSTNPHFRNKYAALDACVEAVLDAFNNNGIMLMQNTHDTENGITVETIFLHESGEMLSNGKLFVPAAKHDPQGFGSALTYARRYSLMAACGIAPEDDDGNKTTESYNAKPAAKPVATKPPAVIAGKDMPWQLKIETKDGCTNEEWLALLVDACMVQLDVAKTPEDVMNIFKVNKAIFDKAKEIDADLFKNLMDTFSATKQKLKG